jgi:hypothetical protein
MTNKKVEVAPGVEVSKSEMEEAKKDGALTVEYWTPERRAERAEASRQRATGVRFSDERRAKISESMRNPSAKQDVE